MKTIYFVRHGQSEGNIGPIRQTAATNLTAKGREQAAFVADRCAKLPIDIIISSTMTRAHETAEIITTKVAKPIEYSDLFVERRRPKEALGKPKDDPVGTEAGRIIMENFHQPDFRFSDEENFSDLKIRSGLALDYLAGLKEDKILVVTHGFFLRILLARITMGADLTAPECKHFVDACHMENTGITVFCYNPERKENPWFLWMWNDHAHLG